MFHAQEANNFFPLSLFTYDETKKVKMIVHAVELVDCISTYSSV